MRGVVAREPVARVGPGPVRHRRTHLRGVVAAAAEDAAVGERPRGGDGAPDGGQATARHRPADDPLLTIHTSVADFVRLIAGAANPVTMWIDKRAQVEGDITLANRLVEMFGGEEPLDIRVAK